MLTSEYKFGEVFTLSDQIESDERAVAFREIMKAGGGGVSLVAFQAGQELATHVAPAEVMVVVLDGDVRFTVLDHVLEVTKGQFLLLGEGVSHSVVAMTDARVMLVKIKP